MKMFIMFSAVSLLSLPAFADTTTVAPANNTTKANNTSIAPARGSSFDDIRTACSNPARFHNQQAPSNIQISCKDVRTTWQVSYDGSIDLPTRRTITTSVQSDKMNVSPSSSAVNDIDSQACPVYEEVQQTVETTRSVSCDDLASETRSGADFCKDAIDALLADNKNAATNPVSTGRKYRLCQSEAKNSKQPAQPMR